MCVYVCECVCMCVYVVCVCVFMCVYVCVFVWYPVCQNDPLQVVSEVRAPGRLPPGEGHVRQRVRVRDVRQRRQHVACRTQTVRIER